jgi:probable F420-dependent oxidoreductase
MCISVNDIANKSWPDVGVVLPRGGPDGDAFREVATTSEVLGFGSVWTTEHIAVPLEITSRYPFSVDGVPSFRADAKWFEGMVALSFAAALTSTVRLGTAVIPLFNRDPLSLAKQAATIDCLSGGRLELGLGAGWLAEEAAVLGHPSDRRGKRLDEAIEVLRTAWTEHPVEHHGEFYDIPPVGVSPKPIQGADVPIWIGGTSPAAVRTTARHATGNILWTQDLEQVAADIATLREARQDIRIAAGIYHAGDDGAMAQRAWSLRALGVDRILLSPPGKLERALACLERFAADVLPELALPAVDAHP